MSWKIKLSMISAAGIPIIGGIIGSIFYYILNKENNTNKKENPINLVKPPPNPNSDPSRPNENDNQNINLNISNLKINPKVGFWNILNYSADGSKNDNQTNKTKILAKIIIDSDNSIIGLSEIKDEKSMSILLTELKRIDFSSKWKMIKSDWSAFFENGNRVSSSKQAQEIYGFVYKSTEFQIKPFWQGTTNESNGAIYINPKLNNEFLDNEKTGYVRPPYGVQFVNKVDKDFTIVITHNDSPGYKTISTKGTTHEPKIPSSKGNFPGQGTQEIWEALHTIDVMRWFDSIDGNNSDLIFMGDTNIKYNKTNKNRPKIFKPLLDDGYKEILNTTNPKHWTTLGFTNYANPYDRIYTKTSFVQKDDGESKYYSKFKKYNLGNVFDKHNFDVVTIFGQPYVDFKKNINNGYWKNDKPTFRFIREVITDHDLIWIKLDLTQIENDNSIPNWNTYITNRKRNKITIPS